MNKGIAGKVFSDCIKKYFITYILLLILNVAELGIFKLYDLPMEPFFYAMILSIVFGIILFAVIYVLAMNKAQKRERLRESILSEWKNLGEADSYEEEDYHEMIQKLGVQIEALTQEYVSEKKDMIDYYTVWVHQIKTPISVLRMRLGAEDDDNSRALRAELFRIEQYVDMVLQYIRLGSETNDIVVEECSLDELIKESIHKYSSQIILRKLKLQYEPEEVKVITDRKWFACIMDQLFSNAVKYTQSGGISIKVEGMKVYFSDTGIGIAAEDVPRIFEKGYTGLNGRTGNKSSGLGLYLCKQAADKISVKLSCESEPGKGTTFVLEFSDKVNIY